jgi:SAM-dependent methyltransferase
MSDEPGHMKTYAKNDRQADALLDWYRQLPGSLIWKGLDERLEQLLPKTFGYHALWLGLMPEDKPIRHSPIKHHCHLSQSLENADAMGLLESLPVQSECIDLVVIIHALELSPDPHQLLREVDRVLVPDGEVLIVHFNPLSWYGLWRSLLSWRGNMPWCMPFYNGYRLRDWLSLLSYDVLSSQGWEYIPPIKRPGLRQRLNWYEQFSGRYMPVFNGLSLIRAKKRVARLTPIRPSWKSGRSFVTNGKLAEPTSREKGLVRNQSE